MQTYSTFKKLFFFIVFFIPIICFSQSNSIKEGFVKTDNPLKTSLDSLVNESVRLYFKDTKAVGVSIGIVLNGENFYYNYGQMENGKSVLPTNKTLYELGSMTKTFTGILLAQGVLDKKINLNDDIRKYLNEQYPNLEYRGAPAKIVHLSNHTSGITRIFPNLWERKEYDSLNPYANYTKKLLFEGLHNMKMDALPGTKYSYSNMAVGLLGNIIEEVYHEEYFSILTKYILKPLRMDYTTINLSNADMHNIAKAHNEKKEIIPFWDSGELPAIGALRSNTFDMVKYIHANNDDVLPAISLSHKFTFAGNEGDLGLNWFLHTTADGYKVYEHGGGTGGSRTSLDCFPELKSGFVILSNSLANRKDMEKELIVIVTKLSSKTKK